MTDDSIEKLLLVGAGGLVGILASGVSGWLNHRRTEKAKRASELIQAYAEWGSSVLKTIRAKRAISRAVELTAYAKANAIPWPEDTLSVKEHQIDASSARSSTDLAQLVLVQLDPNAIDGINKVNHLISKEQLEEAEKAVSGMISTRARKLGKLPPIKHPGETGAKPRVDSVTG